MAAAQPSKHELIAAYKEILRHCIDQRPSGLRQKIAQVLGTHKSFISQITNPNDSTPIPARHLEAIIDVCHLSLPERAWFLEAYGSAHPNQPAVSQPGSRDYKTLHVQVPVLGDSGKQQALETLVQDTVQRICNLVAE